MPRVMNVAEKPSVAREVSKILSNGSDRKRAGKSKYNPIHEFKYTIQTSQPINGSQSHQCDMVFTSVSGHLQTLDFSSEHSWSKNVDPLILLDPSTPVFKSINESQKGIADTLKTEGRQ
jgi:DNA topoisomerase-3